MDRAFAVGAELPSEVVARGGGEARDLWVVRLRDRHAASVSRPGPPSGLDSAAQPTIHGHPGRTDECTCAASPLRKAFRAEVVTSISALRLAWLSYADVVTGVVIKRLRALVDAHRDEIKGIVARHHGHSAALFGSAARGDETPGSDIDLLVDLEPGTRPFAILALGADLEEALGVKVDVGTRESLRERLRAEVLAEAIPL